MKAERLKLIIVILRAALFNIIFWNEKPGMNTVLFDIFICGTVFYLYPYSTRDNTARWLLAGHLVIVSMVVVNNTTVSEIGYGVTLLLFILFSQYIHRSAWFAGGLALSVNPRIPH
ncbi:MAG: hypothetical protein ABI416_17815 [Ginsengibacter sp.]